MDNNEIDVKMLHDVSTQNKTQPDPFNIEDEAVKSLNGLNATIKKRLKRQAESKAATEDFIQTGYSAFQLRMPPFNLDYLATLYESNPYNYAAINAKAISIVGQGYDFVESDLLKERMEAIKTDSAKEKARKRFLKEKRLMHAWFANRNNTESFSEVLLKVWLDYESTGNGYIEVGRDITGGIGYLGHVPSTTVRIRAKRDGYVQILGKDAVFFRNFGDRETSNPIGSDRDPNELIHVKNYSPNSQWYGVPDVIAAMHAVAGHEFAARYNLDYFENKAVPRYIITIKGGQLSETGERKLLEFLQGVKGAAGNHRSVYIPLPEDTDGNKTEFQMHEVEKGTQESSFNNYRKSTRDEVLAVNRTPITKVSVAEGVSLAIARDADKTWSEQVVRPAQMTLEGKIDKIIQELTDALIIKFNEISLTDSDTQSKIWERLVRMQILVPNEVRSEMGLPSLKDGDKPVNLAAQSKAEQTAQATAGRTRDQARSGNAPDTQGEARQPKGDGRTQA